MGNVKIVGSDVCLQVLSLCSTPPGEVLFERRFNLSVEHHLPASTPLALSPNLDLLVVGSTAFTVKADISIVLWEDLEFVDNCPHSYRDWNWRCEISTCGSYIAFEKPAYRHYKDEHYPRPGRSVLIHLDRARHIATRLQRRPISHLPHGAPEWGFNPLEDIRAGLFCFHPSMPLASFSATKGPGCDYNQHTLWEPEILPTESALAVVYLDDDTTLGIDSPNMQGSFRQRLQISDCGTFTYLDGGSHEANDTKSRLLVSNLAFTETRLLSISSEKVAHPTLDRCYELDTGKGATAIGLSMYTFTSDEMSDKFPRLQVSVHHARVGGLSFIPHELGWSFKTWLLLNQDHSQPLKLLLFPRNGRPPVLRILLHSWNDVVKELERQYAEHVSRT